jgi:hypothetical protein
MPDRAGHRLPSCQFLQRGLHGGIHASSSPPSAYSTASLSIPVDPALPARQPQGPNYRGRSVPGGRKGAAYDTFSSVKHGFSVIFWESGFDNRHACTSPQLPHQSSPARASISRVRLLLAPPSGKTPQHRQRSASSPPCQIGLINLIYATLCPICANAEIWMLVFAIRTHHARLGI